MIIIVFQTIKEYNQKSKGSYQKSKMDIVDIYEKIDTSKFFPDKNITVMDYVVTNTIKNFPLKNDSHINAEVNICFDGEGIVGTDEGKKKIHKGDIILINPNANHGFSSMKGASFYIIGFSNLQFQTPSTDVYVCEANIDELCKIIETIKHYASNDNSSNEVISALTKAFLKMVTFETSTTNAHYSIGQGDLLTNRVRDYLDKNFKSDITIESLAKTFNCSKSTLVHSFKKSFGVSVMNYLRKRRLKEILFWLSISDRSVVELANEHGFDTMSYFFKYFRKEVGMTPRQYRLKVRKEKMEQN